MKLVQLLRWCVGFNWEPSVFTNIIHVVLEKIENFKGL